MISLQSFILGLRSFRVWWHYGQRSSWACLSDTWAGAVFQWTRASKSWSLQLAYPCLYTLVAWMIPKWHICNDNDKKVFICSTIFICSFLSHSSNVCIHPSSNKSKGWRLQNLTPQRMSKEKWFEFVQSMDIIMST